ncbi:MAG TPA: phosphoglycerate mutase family protein [Gammaproteobacteria bacterium]|nr:phosphoglycerate mutase family protein [Gammaproteobacteria bacterium]
MSANNNTRARKRRFSRRLVLPIVLFVAVALAVAWFFDEQATSTVIIVRHAEKAAAPKDDPVLSPAGKLRAQALADMLSDVDVVAGVDAIYVSESRRTRDTAKPLANRLDLPLFEHPAADVKGLAERILDEHKGEIVLVVGHSDTVAALIREFGGSKKVPPIEEHEYTNLYILSMPWSGKTKTLRLKYANTYLDAGDT